MKVLRAIAYFFAGPAVLLGCSSLPAPSSAPGEVAISVVEPERSCASLPDTINVGLLIANQGQGTFRTYIDTLPGPPYKLSWLSYSVLSDSPSGRNVEWKHGAGGHGPLPQNTLAIGPNDSTSVFAKIYGTAQMDKTALYRIRVEDQDDQIYLSNAFKICQPIEATGRPSNNSFKPNPLRGSA
jgi:hypothetical protein